MHREVSAAARGLVVRSDAGAGAALLGFCHEELVGSAHVHESAIRRAWAVFLALFARGLSRVGLVERNGAAVAVCTTRFRAGEAGISKLARFAREAEHAPCLFVRVLAVWAHAAPTGLVLSGTELAWGARRAHAVDGSGGVLRYVLAQRAGRYRAAQTTACRFRVLAVWTLAAPAGLILSSAKMA